MGKDSFAYVGVCVLTYVLLSVTETLVLSPLIDLVSDSSWFAFYVYLFAFIVINPILARIAGNKIKPVHKTESDK